MSPKSRKPTPVERLVAAMDRCAVARGEAQWMNGYRAGRGEKADPELYAKELRQWHQVELAERAFRRAAQNILRQVGRDA